MSDEPDITDWPLDQLNDLTVAVYDGVAGVEVVADYVVDELGDHGVNSQADKS